MQWEMVNTQCDEFKRGMELNVKRNSRRGEQGTLSSPNSPADQALAGWPVKVF
jgi:hypothetical protein